MKYLLPLACLALASCAAQKALPQYTEAEKAAQRGGISYWQPDSTSCADTLPHTPRWAVAVPPVKVDSVIVEWQPTFLEKLLGLQPKPYHVAVVPARIGKKSTINVYHNSTVTNAEKKAQVAVGAGATASVIEKKAGPAQVASDSSTQNALLGGGNLAAVRGNGNTLPQTATTQEAADWRATLAKPAGYVLAGLGTVLIVGGAIYLIVAYRRRNLLGNNGTV
jgi:hypothetical protein